MGKKYEGAPEFYYSTTLSGTGLPIVKPFGTSSAGRVKRVRITDIKATSSGQAANVSILGQGGSYKPLNFRIASSASLNFTFNVPYPLVAVSSTGVVRGIVASASGSGVNIVVTGYVDYNN